MRRSPFRRREWLGDSRFRRQSPNQENAIAFVNLLLGRSGTAALTAVGPAPITPALVSTADYPRLPKSLRPLIKAGPVAP